tara:strand:- start:1707 stop:2429 length:723 start_codon:yes stop_codon:yes gene_type:complete
MVNIKLIRDNCLNEIKNIKEKSIDCILTDLPYGITKNEWDIEIDLKLLWENFNNILKPNGIIILTAVQPFTSKLVISNQKMFKYEIIWEKTIGSGQLNIKHQPLRVHESILIFYNKRGTYNEQLTEGKPYSINRTKVKGSGYNKQTSSNKQNDGYRHAKSVIKISNPRIKEGHPTQKPIELLEYLVKTYSNENDTVLDCCMGSGSTGVACINLNRNFIGIELNNEYFEKAKYYLNNLNNK